jgi:putative lipoic acid-binding regulatory protein
MKDLEAFRALLEKETYPLAYTLKLIGKNSPEFNQSIADFERDNPKMTLQTKRESGGGKHLAYSYLGVMSNADEVVALYLKAEKILDLLVIL